MRSCIYCGKELKDGEVCDCPQSAAHRRAKETEAKKAESGTDTSGEDYKYNPNYNSSSYQTGYTKKESKFTQAWNRFKMKRSVHKAERSGKSFFSSLAELIKNFIVSPVDTVMNPPSMSKGTILSLAAAQDAVIWLCVYFIMSNVRRGPFAMLASLMMFNGANGYRNILHMLMALVSGAVSGVLVFFLYSGIFYGINRLIFRLNTRYWDFSQRLILTGIPTAVICMFGALFSIFSSTTLMILMLCGAVSFAVLTYEALRTEWISQSAGKTVYAMMLGFFVFFSFVCYLIRLS